MNYWPSWLKKIYIIRCTAYPLAVILYDDYETFWFSVYRQEGKLKLVCRRHIND
jgi:hypothetical protein